MELGVISVKVCDSDEFGDTALITTATELFADFKDIWGPEEQLTRTEIAAHLEDIDDYLETHFDEDDRPQVAQNLLDGRDQMGWGKSKDWREARRYLEAVAAS